MDIEKHCSEEEQDGFVTERFRRGNFVNMKPEDYYANNGSPLTIQLTATGRSVEIT